MTLVVIVTLTRLPKSSGLTPTRWMKARLVTVSVTRLSLRADRSDTLINTIFNSSNFARIHLTNQINPSKLLLIKKAKKQRQIKSRISKQEIYPKTKLKESIDKTETVK